MTSEIDLNQLITKCGNRDQQAFQTMYLSFAPKMLAILVRMLHDRQIAEDVMQDSMVAIWDAADTFDPSKAQASTWMISIARYRALDQIRKLGRYREVLDEDKMQIIDVLNSNLEQEATLSDATTNRLKQCFEKLNNNAAQSIQLAYLDGYTNKEIATILERPIGSVKSWIRRGLLSLRGCLQK